MVLELSKTDHELIDLALREDLGGERLDLTTDRLFGSEKVAGSSRVFSREDSSIIFSGLAVAQAILQKLGAEGTWQIFYHDADTVPKGSTIFEVRAPLPILLRA